jgi:hypothetical protein
LQQLSRFIEIWEENFFCPRIKQGSGHERIVLLCIHHQIWVITPSIEFSLKYHTRFQLSTIGTNSSKLY